MPKKDRSALFSDCRKYRYGLWRWWDTGKPPAMFIGLNPSTADETQDDPTIRRCVRFAKDWGYGGLCMANLFAFRATDPKVMKKALDPRGPENDRWLRHFASYAGVVVFAWGAHGTYMERYLAVPRMIENGNSLGHTKKGHPSHPLYLKASTPLERYGEP